MSKEHVIIPFKDKMVKIIFEDFDEQIDVDELTTIDWTNLYAEIVTIPALMNRVGLWKAEAENQYSSFKLECDIYSAKQAEYYRKTLVTRSTDTKGNPKVKYPTKDQVDNAVLLDSGVVLKRKKLIRLKKEADYMDALYWAVKSKEMKINRISENMGLSPEEFEKELVEGKFNGVIVRVKNKLI